MSVPDPSHPAAGSRAGRHHHNGADVGRWSDSSKLASLAARVVAAHGGAGATTLATHLAAQLQAAVEEPQLDEAGRLVGAGERANGQRQLASWGLVPAVVVASGTAYGTKRAMARSGELDGRYGVPVVVAVVADGPLAEPIAARSRLRALGSEVEAVIRVPYVPRWRFEDCPHRDA